MVKLIAGEKGKGKTKYILDRANSEAKTTDGVIIYLDKNSKHMFELDRNIRLINVREYPISDFDVLMGFICGLISGNSDIQSVYFDSFLTLANLEDQDPAEAIDKMIVLSDRLGVEFIISLSLGLNELDERFREITELSL
ncbi:MAG: twitching motility protein PilT [Parasporobacterium sp.]|nr:twitching motility protein PilT [Parasporobacterium sp.]